MTEIIEKIISWAERIPEIRVIILEGSMVSLAQVDELSDYDLNLFITDHEKFSRNEKWLKIFDDVVLYQKPGFYYKGTFIPSYLVLYAHSPRIDFSFWDIEILKDFVTTRTLPEFYKNGYKILLDKDGIAKNLPEPSHKGYAIHKPDKAIVLKNIYDFWFEVYCIAKYLNRGSLFYAKMIENSYIKQFLLQMIIWSEASVNGWEKNYMHLEGKNLEKFISNVLKNDLSECFSGYDEDAILQSLFKMMIFFEGLSRKVCHELEIDYPEEKIINIKQYISRILSDII